MKATTMKTTTMKNMAMKSRILLPLNLHQRMTPENQLAKTRMKENQITITRKRNSPNTTTTKKTMMTEDLKIHTANHLEVAADK